MQWKKLQDLAQHVLDLNQQPYVPPVNRKTPGLIDAVAALLLAAIGLPRDSTSRANIANRMIGMLSAKYG
jgi:hypothetical protein